MLAEEFFSFYNQKQYNLRMFNADRMVLRATYVRRNVYSRW